MEEKKQITGDTIIAEILKINPQAAPILMGKGMHCLGCSIASGETLSQACEVHGLALDELLKELNK
ncbi:disulfide oxidoreductase [candidate division WOR-1 bacterium RIFOXYA12_FULL_43_27]|uniref:Disulfide oxidoreductase n=1 Tax=candidate division WOR-1 bacterium RIFOXYC2_FULL_46_14 TaxID=1802587 RepID=A0A1F4U4N8_UNCSA|nr:MAG: disulfide oxidoreductase [candidate division WOR-1 bacterium RIFOXYA12_FULL_43_27]OGC20778.1 MAG: disulfide oxidoreductase [candidate division WOR-1 bacterium RIFOXYB2_FULL_46_45]OGC31485.1 MAG: disulfide oxidoreductase [candidate division WOR-1 bacterium RIFOXYA2_FULL_46_56]OGC39892.1 MAG: disulfide oxidoreductase [candidate division WOR-1 bacterium RIFOXYC2_FULL_46_14]